MKRNISGLIPANKRTPEERRELGRKGGLKAGEIRRTLKTFREIGELVLQAKPPAEVLDIFCKRFPNIPREEMNYKVVAYLAQLQKSINLGDTGAFDRLVETSGEKEPTNIKMDSSISQKVDLSNVSTEDLLKMVDKADSKIKE